MSQKIVWKKKFFWKKINFKKIEKKIHYDQTIMNDSFEQYLNVGTGNDWASHRRAKAWPTTLSNQTSLASEEKAGLFAPTGSENIEIFISAEGTNFWKWLFSCFGVYEFYFWHFLVKLPECWDGMTLRKTQKIYICALLSFDPNLMQIFSNRWGLEPHRICDDTETL